MTHKAGDVVDVGGKKCRVLSAKEILDLDHNTQVVFLGSNEPENKDVNCPIGTILTKGFEEGISYIRDDLSSCAFSYTSKDDYDYFEEGEIGLEITENVPSTKDSLGIYRPDIETRKVGKVPMHMAIDGFPLALTHIAEIMGWAGEAKGYKLHDWRNLPNAKEAFPAAGYRHMIENAKMKSEGIDPIQRLDHESGKLHIGHHVFNLLAELELILSGKIT